VFYFSKPMFFARSRNVFDKRIKQNTHNRNWVKTILIYKISSPREILKCYSIYKFRKRETFEYSWQNNIPDYLRNVKYFTKLFVQMYVKRTISNLIYLISSTYEILVSSFYRRTKRFFNFVFRSYLAVCLRI